MDKFFNPRFKTKEHILQLVLVLAVFCLTIARFTITAVPPQRANMMCIAIVRLPYILPVKLDSVSLIMNIGLSPRLSSP
jgi:hypothetical protein